MPYALLSCSFVTLLYCYCFLNEINGDGDGDVAGLVYVIVQNFRDLLSNAFARFLCGR